MSHRSGRHFLQIPGPTNVPDRILRAIDRPAIDHRGPEFAALTRKILGGIKEIFRTNSHVVIYAASGTGAWEAALVWVDGRFEYSETRMIALAPKTGILYYVAFVDRGEVRRIISLRRANRREVKHYVQRP